MIRFIVKCILSFILLVTMIKEMEKCKFTSELLAAFVSFMLLVSVIWYL